MKYSTQARRQQSGEWVFEALGQAYAGQGESSLTFFNLMRLGEEGKRRAPLTNQSIDRSNSFSIVFLTAKCQRRPSSMSKHTVAIL